MNKFEKYLTWIIWFPICIITYTIMDLIVFIYLHFYEIYIHFKKQVDNYGK